MNRGQTKSYSVLLGAVLLFTQPSLAFDFMGGITPPSQLKTSFRLTNLWQPKSSQSSGPGEVGLHQASLLGSIPIYKDEKDAVALTSKTNWLNLYPNSTHTTDFYDLQIGATYSHQISERRIWSVSSTFGSASDKPFEDSSVITIGATAMYTFPGSETESWLLLVNYSNNRPFLNNIPLPGFAYIYTPSKAFRGTFGAPFASIYWQFIDKWSLTVFTVVPWVAKAQIAYSIFGPVQIFTGIDFSQMTFLQFGRANSEERTFYDEKKAFIGARSPLSRITFAELETGYSFGRRFFAAEKYRLNPPNPNELGASWYLRIALSVAF